MDDNEYDNDYWINYLLMIIILNFLLFKMENLFNKITEQLIERNSTHAFCNNVNLDSIPFSNDKFIKVEYSKSNSKKLAFIDGGNIEIIGNNNFSLQLMRVYYNIYQDKKKIKDEKQEFIVLITTKANSNNKQIYHVEVYTQRENQLVDTIELPTKDNGFKQKPDSIISKIRRLYEIKIIKNISGNLEKEDIVTMDGSLETKFEKEKIIMNSIIKICNEKKIMLCAINKTSSLTTNSGTNLIGYINSISNESDKNQKWFYYPLYVYKNEQEYYNIKTIAKLHTKSQYAFLIETISNNKDNNISNELLSNITTSLSQTSKDPIFLGYPYGLIDADQNARCTENEKRYLQTRFLLLNKQNNIKLRCLLNSGNAHSILDSINF